MSNYVYIEPKKALMLRNELLVEYRFHTQGLSQQEKARALSKHAFEQGYIDEKSPMFGETLANYIRTRKKKKIHWWVLKSALDILISKQWSPYDTKTWTAFTYSWLFRFGPFEDLNSILESLPDHIDKDEAVIWFEPLENRFQQSERTKAVSWIENSKIKQVTSKYLSQIRLIEDFIDEFQYEDFQGAEEDGYSIQCKHYLYEDLRKLNDLKPSEFQYLKS